MKQTFQILKNCGHTCGCKTEEPEVVETSGKIRPLMPTQINGSKLKPEEKPEQTKMSGKIRPLLNIKTKY
jgi:hypothetical protein